MDPNAALKKLRKITKLWFDQEGLAFSSLDEMMTTFQGLDEWLSKGGFLPADWAAKP